MLQHFWEQRQGAEGSEYALVAALVSIAIIGSVSLFGTTVSGLIAYVGTNVPTMATP